jgi:pimeloyl-ACP methyl ester carboxylesterase
MRPVHASLLALALCGCRPASAENRTTEHAAIGRTAVTRGRFQPTAFSVDVRGHGPAVILIPGLGCPGSVWDDTVHHLRGYQTHTLTLAGFAGTPRIDRPLARTTVEELAAYIRHHHLASPVIIGHSLGGFIAYWLAVREPELVGPTIIVDASAGPAPGNSDDGAAASARDKWRDASEQQFRQQVKEMFGQMSVKPARMDPVIAQVARSDRRAIGDAVYELSVTTVRDDLDRIRAPVLLVLADGSLQHDYRRQAEPIRDHKVVVVPDTGHFVMLDAPEAFFAAIDDFLARHSRLATERIRRRRG